MAVLEFAALALAFQALTLPWGGIVRFGALGVMLLGISVISVAAARNRGVHPFGYRRAHLVVGAWALSIGAVSGWFWIANGPHSAPAVLTTSVAFVGFLPMALLGVRLVRTGR